MCFLGPKPIFFSWAAPLSADTLPNTVRLPPRRCSPVVGWAAGDDDMTAFWSSTVPKLMPCAARGAVLGMLTAAPSETSRGALVWLPGLPGLGAVVARFSVPLIDGERIARLSTPGVDCVPMLPSTFPRKVRPAFEKKLRSR